MISIMVKQFSKMRASKRWLVCSMASSTQENRRYKDIRGIIMIKPPFIMVSNLRVVSYSRTVVGQHQFNHHLALTAFFPTSNNIIGNPSHNTLEYAGTDMHNMTRTVFDMLLSINDQLLWCKNQCI